MDEITERCRYLLDDGQQCAENALVATVEPLLCRKHGFGSMRLLDRVVEVRIQEQAVWTPERQALEMQRIRQQEADAANRCVVYYIQFRDRIKIGTTTYLEGRLQGLPYDRILVTEPGSGELERRRHAQFAHCRDTGEWFHADDEKLLAHIEALRVERKWDMRRSEHWDPTRK
jgi:Meiotically up-regulated gene 113